MSQTPSDRQDSRQSPLDDEEARLARLIAQLPGAVPDPQTDARLMAAARKACESPPRRRPLPWGLGGALAASLALLVYWQSPQLPEPSPVVNAPSARMPAIATPARPASPSAESSVAEASDPPAGAEIAPMSGTSVDASEAGRTAARSEPRMSIAQDSPARVATDESASRAAPPIADAVEYDPSRLGSQDAPGALAERLARRDARAREATQPAASEHGVSEPPETGESGDFESQTAEPESAGRESAQSGKPSYRLVQPEPIAAPTPEPVPFLPPVESDVELAAEDWLARIRERVAHGPQDEAVRSLILFRARHPDYPLPEDLSALLR